MIRRGVGATALRIVLARWPAQTAAVRPPRVAPSPRTPCLLVTSNPLST
ncbi:hypothetical protein [Dictyobacter vulcani]|nr:hypothetical protein [Dictyobacter vulcani]